MWAICKKEWVHYFSSLSGYFIISFYLLVNGLLLFVLPNYNILNFGYASLQVYFDFAPWLLMILVPAVTMRSFSDEYKQGTYELLSTLPIQPIDLIIGKYLGSLGIVLLAVLPTLLYAFAIDSLSAVGGLDWGATLGAYIGIVALVAVYVAVGIFMSSTTQNNVIALLATIGMVVFLFKGFDWIAQFAYFQNGADYYLQQLGLSAHYQSISRGLLALHDVLYCFSLVIFFGLGAKEQLVGKVRYFWVLLLLFGLNYLSSQWTFQIDLTKEKRYEIGEQSKTVLKSLKKPVNIHLYFGGDLPPHYKKLEIATIQFLEQMVQLNPDQIQWSQELPADLYQQEALYQFYDSLSKMGLPIERVLNETEITDKKVDQLIVPGLLIEMEGKQPIALDLRSSKKIFKPYNIIKDIPEVDLEASLNAAEALLEYKFIQAIYLLNRTVIPNIAYLIGNGQPLDLTINDLGVSIKEQYQLGIFDLKKGYPDARKINTLLIVKPTIPFSDLDKLKIDQYIVDGGNVIWAIDPLYAEYDSLKNTNGSYVAFSRGLNLDDQFFKYGVRMNANLIQDLDCAKLPMVVGVEANGDPAIQRVPWPYYPFLYAGSSHPLVQNLDRVLSIFPSSIDTIKLPGIQKTILLATDSNSRLVSTPSLISLSNANSEAILSQFQMKKITVGVLLEGAFKSAFTNRVSKEYKDSLLIHLGRPYKTAATATAKQIVLSDADILTNFIDPSSENPGPMPMGMLPYERYAFANNDFFQNAIAYLNEPIALLESRKKNRTLRLLDKDKVNQGRIFWQLVLLLGPLFILLIGYFMGAFLRKSRFVL